MLFEPKHQVVDLGSSVLSEAYWQVARLNGRLMASLMEPVLCKTFENLSPATNANDYFDLHLNEVRTVEVRTIKDGALFSFEASANVGGGRDGRNLQATQTKLDHCDYWIFCNISKFPQVQLYVFTKAKVQAICKAYGKTRQQFTLNQIQGIM